MLEGHNEKQPSRWYFSISWTPCSVHCF